MKHQYLTSKQIRWVKQHVNRALDSRRKALASETTSYRMRDWHEGRYAGYILCTRSFCRHARLGLFKED